MAKQSGGMPKIDEDFMKELISQGILAKRESQPDDVGFWVANWRKSAI